MSAAILVLAHGTKGSRVAGKNTRFMLHSVSGGSGGTLGEIKMSLSEIERIQEFYIQDLVLNTKMKRKQIEKIFQQNIDFYFSADEAKKFGIVDKIE
jgi:ATP-dependent protease ClpP protease subunit